MARITINGISIDPVAHGPALAAANLISSDAAAANFILVQTNQPLDQSRRDELARLGAVILEYVPENTYICQYQPADLRPIRALPYVEWVNVYLEGFKVASALRPGATTRTANLLSAAAVDTLSKDRVTVDVVLHKQVTGASVRDKIAAAAGLSPATLRVGNNKIRLTVERRRLAELAKIDEVRHIEPYIPPRLANDIARGIMRVDDTQARNAHQGDGQIIAVADTGFDKGLTDDVHPAFVGRVIKLYPLGRVGDASDPDGHGTHVAGSVLGDGVFNDGTLIRGTAPKAQLVLQSVLDSNGGLGGLPDDLYDLFITPYRDDGARVHSNSWGANTSGAYNSNSTEVDDFVWNHRDLVVCFAAGNAGTDSRGTGTIDLGSVGAPGTAKNCVAVGASENNRPDFRFPNSDRRATYGQGWPQDFPHEPISSDGVADNPEGMAAFSSRGPASNNRVRPDVVAPGTAILSTRSRVATGSVWAPSRDPLYVFEGGTSMATPLVAGCAAVVRQFLQEQGVASPSAALVKAMLINGSKIMTGQYLPPEVGAPPDNSQGFGRIDLAATVGPYAAGQTVTFKDESRVLDTGGEEHTSQAVNSGQSLKATLVWTDPAGEALQNDLDLIVRTPNGLEFHGNTPAGSTDFDRSNNAEQVIVANLTQGNVDIAVRAFRITAPQTYALVVRVS
jgi:hypothetical protein